jgi:hypothetical protein
MTALHLNFPMYGVENFKTVSLRRIMLGDYNNQLLSHAHTQYNVSYVMRRYMG